MKQSAFVFPITLFALLLIAGFSIAAFSLQQTHVNFLRITGAGLAESHVHDVTITRESPNYRPGI